METTNATTETARPTDLIRIDKALEALDIKASTFWVAMKRHPYLKDAVVTEIHPETGRKWTRISQAAIDKYAAERRAGGSSAAHPGELKYTMFLKESEVEEAAKILSKKFGREITIDRLYRAKAETNGVEDETETEETDDEA